jgi:hypothetical protein
MTPASLYPHGSKQGCCNNKNPAWEPAWRWLDKLTPEEQYAVQLIDGRLLGWSPEMEKTPTFLSLPHADYDRRKAQVEAGIPVIASGGTRFNVRDPFPMPPEWYRTNGTKQNAADRIKVSTSLEGVHSTYTASGSYEQPGRAQVLVCANCYDSSDMWDQFAQDAGSTLKVMAPVVRGIALAASYVPVVGTAVSFVLSTAINLAEGQRIDDAALDAMGAALPGQPASGIAFNATRAFVQGDRIDKAAVGIVVDSLNLPVDAATKKYITQAVAVVSSIVVAVARGREITEATLTNLYEEMPDAGKKAMDVARRLAAGEKVKDVVVTEAEQAAANTARSMGQAAVNKYITEAAYQKVMDTLDPILQGTLKAAFIAGEIERRQNPVQLGFTTQEQNVASNDVLAAKGQKLIAGGAAWKGITLFNIRKGPSFKITVQAFDALAGRTVPREMVYAIDDFWRRGFEIAIGLCEGLVKDSLAQQKVRASLVNVHAQQGFDAGQQVQFERTAAHDALHSSTEMKSSKASLLSSLFPKPAAVAPPAPAVVVPAPGQPVPLSPSTVIGPEIRVALGNRGIALANADPAIRAERVAQPTPATQRGFDIATALLEDKASPADIAKVKATLGAENVAGFNAAVSAFTERHAVRISTPFFAPGQTAFVQQAAVASQMAAAQAQSLLEDRGKWVAYYRQRKAMEDR